MQSWASVEAGAAIVPDNLVVEEVEWVSHRDLWENPAKKDEGTVGVVETILVGELEREAVHCLLERVAGKPKSFEAGSMRANLTLSGMDYGGCDTASSP